MLMVKDDFAQLDFVFPITIPTSTLIFSKLNVGKIEKIQTTFLRRQKQYTTQITIYKFMCCIVHSTKKIAIRSTQWIAVLCRNG